MVHRELKKHKVCQEKPLSSWRLSNIISSTSKRILIFSQVSEHRDSAAVLEQLATALSDVQIDHVIFTLYSPQQDLDAGTGKTSIIVISPTSPGLTYARQSHRLSPTIITPRRKKSLARNGKRFTFNLRSITSQTSNPPSNQPSALDKKSKWCTPSSRAASTSSVPPSTPSTDLPENSQRFHSPVISVANQNEASLWAS